MSLLLFQLVNILSTIIVFINQGVIGFVSLCLCLLKLICIIYELLFYFPAVISFSVEIRLSYLIIPLIFINL